MAAINQEAIAAERQRLYESASLRDDLDDTHASALLQWGEQQVERLAAEYPEDFEQKARFLRQLMKNINRFVGQRQYNDEAGQREYMEKVSKYMQPLGFGEMSAEELLSQLPTEKADHASNLQAIFQTLGSEEQTEQPEPTSPTTPHDPLKKALNLGARVALPLEKSNEHSINQRDNRAEQESNPYDESEE